MFSSESKRRQKADQKEKQKTEKAAATLADVTTAIKQVKINEEEISPNEYFKLRTAAVAELKKSPATDPYPHKYHVSISLEEFIEKYNGLTDGQTLDDVQLRYFYYLFNL